PKYKGRWLLRPREKTEGIENEARLLSQIVIRSAKSGDFAQRDAKSGDFAQRKAILQFQVIIFIQSLLLCHPQLPPTHKYNNLYQIYLFFVWFNTLERTIHPIGH